MAGSRYEDLLLRINASHLDYTGDIDSDSDSAAPSGGDTVLHESFAATDSEVGSTAVAGPSGATEVYSVVWLAFYGVLACTCLVHLAALLRVRSHRRARELRAHWITSALVLLFASGRLVEFSLRTAGSKLFYGTQGRDLWTAAHFLFLLPQAAVISVESATIYWWDRVLYVVDAGHARPHTVQRAVAAFNVVLYAAVGTLCLWLLLDTKQPRRTVDLVTNFTIATIEVVLIAFFSTFGTRLRSLHRNLFQSSAIRAGIRAGSRGSRGSTGDGGRRGTKRARVPGAGARDDLDDDAIAERHFRAAAHGSEIQMSDDTLTPVGDYNAMGDFSTSDATPMPGAAGPVAPLLYGSQAAGPSTLEGMAAADITADGMSISSKTGRAFEKTAMTLHMFSRVAVVATVCLFVHVALLLNDCVSLIAKGHFPGVSPGASGSGGGDEYYNWTDPIGLLMLYRVCEVAPALSVLIVLMVLHYWDLKQSRIASRTLISSSWIGGTGAASDLRDPAPYNTSDDNVSETSYLPNDSVTNGSAFTGLHVSNSTYGALDDASLHSSRAGHGEGGSRQEAFGAL